MSGNVLFVVHDGDKKWYVQVPADKVKYYDLDHMDLKFIGVDDPADTAEVELLMARLGLTDREGTNPDLARFIVNAERYVVMFDKVITCGSIK